MKSYDETSIKATILSNGEEYIGFYCSEDIGVTYELKLDSSSKLYMDVRIFGRLRFEFGRDDEFKTNYSWKGKFLRKDGKISGFIFTENSISYSFLFNFFYFLDYFNYSLSFKSC